jgi:hypothetical protein
MVLIDSCVISKQAYLSLSLTHTHTLFLSLTNKRKSISTSPLLIVNCSPLPNSEVRHNYMHGRPA